MKLYSFCKNLVTMKINFLPKNETKWRWMLGLSMGCWTALSAQTPLPLTDVSAFKNPTKTWSIVGGVTGSPKEAALKGQKGTGVLLGTPGKGSSQSDYLVTNTEHGDLKLSLDFMLPQGANSGVYLMGRYEVQLYDSWGVQNPKASDCGGIYERWDENRKPNGYEGHPPRMNAAKAPGLWQHLEVEFEAPKFDGSGKKIANARFVKVELNGTIVHQNLEVFGPTRAALFTDEKARGPLAFQGDHGPVALRNISMELLDKAPVTVGPVEYTFYTGKFNTIPKLDTMKAKPVRTGTAEKLSSVLADGRSDFLIVFNGTIQAPEADNYQFILQWMELGQLIIDGRTVFDGELSFDKPRTIDVPLTAGEHKFTLLHAKNKSWLPKVLGLYVQRKGSHLQELHGFGSVPDTDPVPVITVHPRDQVEQVRSFVYMPGYNEGDGHKKLRVLHLGDPSGVHYSYDLDQATVLMSWRGAFINMSDAWHERGEAQTASPLGSPVLALWGTSPLGMAGSSTPDSTAGLVYKGYKLDEVGHPTFRYQLAGGEFTDFIRPYENGRGLSRTVSLKDGSNLAYRLAKGKTITALSKGLYLIDGNYYVQTGAKAQVVANNGGQELRVSGSPSVQYELIW
ncbi:hypothetical protein BWI93_25585 [Siphonobacter sp. BAB-5385]|nr:hypothetical protein BWI93_25585 [Siphonobacter sp. BAB-5385]